MLLKKAHNYYKNKGLLFLFKRTVRYLILIIYYKLTELFLFLFKIITYPIPNEIIEFLIEAVITFEFKLLGFGFSYNTINHEVNSAIKLLKLKPNLAIDIGGNIGNYTQSILSKAPNCSIFIFEPSSHNVTLLNKRFQNKDNVKVMPYAVSSNNGTAKLFSNMPGSGLASLQMRDLSHIGIEFDVFETVETISFETFWKNALKKQSIDIVKLDIEGHELVALESFGESLSHIKVIQFEFGGCNIDTRTYFKDFWNFFNRNKFSIYRISPLGAIKILKYKENHECFRTSNYLCLNTRFS